ncbi:hypothetical protein CPter291_3068 [Collimonas pratensis]|uniref:Uncharacterized protein n=1 Tax=Collimonas pratensis TaxID=279113 RepID=A0ABN4MCF6_9BURK|nr:hypothetical protein CPter291_3068 [Collimonas pratensis]
MREQCPKFSDARAAFSFLRIFENNYCFISRGPMFLTQDQFHRQ